MILLLQITYPVLLVSISIRWIALRMYWAVKTKTFQINRELHLLLVYICIVVVTRIPLAIICPFVYKRPDTHVKVITKGFGFSLLIEILSLRSMAECRTWMT